MDRTLFTTLLTDVMNSVSALEVLNLFSSDEVLQNSEEYDNLTASTNALTSYIDSLPPTEPTV